MELHRKKHNQKYRFPTQIKVRRNPKKKSLPLSAVYTEVSQLKALNLEAMAYHKNELHFVLFPFFAQGHLIPMVDIAKLLAQHGATVTIVTTPQNTERFSKTLARATDSGLRIQLSEVPFPSQESGLPKDCENFDMLPSLGQAMEFFSACNMLREPVEKLLLELKPKPSCIISDMIMPYTIHVAKKFGIPRVSFIGYSAFCMLCLHSIASSGILEKITLDSESFPVPSLPGYPIMLTKNQLPSALFTGQNVEEFNTQILEAEKSTYGLIVNSFDELESLYVNEYKKIGKLWCIGPVSLCNKDSLDKLHRGKEPAIQETTCLEWLDSQKPGSVIYVCLGSLCNIVTSQLIELGLGLEASNRPFVWVIRGGDSSEELIKWLEKSGFEDRIKDRGLVVKGWAPQLVILSHESVGGFLTHCGWNSTLEGICSGKPMVTWPLFGDQFCNEKLVTEVLRIGVKVGADVTVKWGEEDKVGVLVKREDVKKAIDALMDEEDEESEERRRRVKELSEIAKEVTMEGGSSYCNIEDFMKDIMEQDCSYKINGSEEIDHVSN